jgi:Protein of unknown function (DUF433)
MGGRACVRGIRITVALVVNLVANGMPAEDITREYPDLERERSECHHLSTPKSPAAVNPRLFRVIADCEQELLGGRS